MSRPFLQTLFERLAVRTGVKVHFADRFGYAGYFEFSNGRRAFFKGTSFDLNPQGASKIAADKDYCAKILKTFGYSVPDGVLVFSPQYRTNFEYTNREIYNQLIGIEGAIEFAYESGFPLFVKPNEESEGLGVSRVYSISQLVDDVQSLFSWSDRVLIQRPLAGSDHRVVILDGEVISAYRRTPLEICGDGVNAIRFLVDSKISALREKGRGKKFEADDPRILRELAHQKLGIDAIPAAGRVVTLLPNANLSTGGEALDLTEAIHPSYREFCAKLARDIGLTLCGIDLFAKDISVPLDSPIVLEINSAPGLNNFAATGERENEAVEKLYERLLLRLRDDPWIGDKTLKPAASIPQPSLTE